MLLEYICIIWGFDDDVFGDTRHEDYHDFCSLKSALNKYLSDFMRDLRKGRH